jgi:hypothetical protein
MIIGQPVRTTALLTLHSVKTRCAMTLIELALALTLAAMLLVALVGVLRSVATQLTVADQHRTERWPTQLVDLLYRDLLVAESISARDGMIWIEGVLPTYEQQVSDKERIVGYGCVSIYKDSSALVRMDGQTRGYIAIGPRRLVVERIDGDGYPQPLPMDAGPVPRRVRIWVFRDDLDNTVFVRDLLL